MSHFDTVIATVPTQHRTTVALYALFVRNTTPGIRPSDAARTAVDAYNANPYKVLHRPSGRDLDGRKPW